MIDYILDNMIVNKKKHSSKARKLREGSAIEYTICEEIAYEQRLGPVEERDRIKNEAKTLADVKDFKLLADIANEMIDIGVLDLDEGGGDTMIGYEARVEQPMNLFVTKRIVVSDDSGLRAFCVKHDVDIIGGEEYLAVLESI